MCGRYCVTMKNVAIVAVVALLTVVKGDITKTNPPADGAYLRFNSSGVNIPSSVAAANEYTCQVANQGKRIHETLNPTPYDCKDKSCHNTCRGGQCVAYVTCSCKRNGKWAPNTACWRPGQRIRRPDGKCNRNVAPNTAIATFDSRGRYTRHAAVFIRCKDDKTVLAYDQWCCRSVGYSEYKSTHSFFAAFATITSPHCGDRPSWKCRVQNAGPTCCPVSVPSCKGVKYWWEALETEKEIF